MHDFHGAKIVLLRDDNVLVYQRDDFPGLPFPGMWDFAGGAREGDETPVECVVRETAEEFAIELDPATFIWHREYTSVMDTSLRAHFFVAPITQAQVDAIRFGPEGQQWALVAIDELLAREDFVPHLRERLLHYLERDR